MDNNLQDLSNAMKQLDAVFSQLPPDVLKANPNLIQDKNKLIEGIKNGDTDFLNEYLKRNASHIK